MTAAVKCRDCQRPLRAAKSRERGYGRQCWEDHKPARVAPHRSPVVARRRVSAIPGQTQLDLDEPQEDQ